MNKIVLLLTLINCTLFYSQATQEEQRINETRDLIYEANKDLENNNFSGAEAKYRKAIAKDPKNTEAKFNLGVAYYDRDKNTESARRFIEAAEAATTKEQKHRIYHNLGNTLMNSKEYKAAVEAYKNALRNNPADEETRYNLALAKLLLEEHGDDGGGEEDNKEEEEEKDEGEQEEEEDSGGDSGDKEDKGDEGDDEEEKNSEDDSEEGEPEQEESGEPQQVEGELSPQQIQSLLEAMNNEERKVQEKLNKEKQKGTPTRSEKDW